FGLGVEITERLVRSASVRYEQLRDIVKEPALVPHSQRGDAQSLTEVLTGRDIERAGYGSTDIGPMPLVLREADDLVVREDRTDEADIVEVRAAAVGVVDEEDVAGVDVVTELLHDGLALEMQGADVN